MDPNGNGYDIYDLFDLGEFDQKGAISTKWGSRTELEEMMRQAHTLGIGVIWDAVLNHKAGAEYPEQFDAVAVDPKRASYVPLFRFPSTDRRSYRTKQGNIQAIGDTWLDWLRFPRSRGNVQRHEIPLATFQWRRLG